MVALHVCPWCNVHVKAFERRCLHCGGGLPTDWSTVGATATALLLGLSLSSCSSMTPEPADIYGAAPSDDNDDEGEPRPARNPEAKQPAAKQPATKQPEAKQPEAKQPEAKQPDPKSGPPE